MTVGETILNRGRAVTAADDADRVACGDCRGNRWVPSSNGGISQTPIGPFQTIVLSLTMELVEFGGFRAACHLRNHRRSHRGNDLLVAVGTRRSHRHGYRPAERVCRPRREVFGQTTLSSRQGSADLFPCASEGVGHRAADEDFVADAEEILITMILSGPWRCRGSPRTGGRDC